MSDRPIDAELARISRRIRRWREEGGLTLSDLGERSGLATSTVQKVETGQMIPSVAVLLKLARGLGRRPTEFVHDGGFDQEVLHLRAADQDQTGGSGAMHVTRLSGDLYAAGLEMWRVVLQPGVSSGNEPIAYNGEELVCCEAGQVTFLVGDASYTLEAGDSLHFKANLPHSWSNEGAEPTRFTVTGTVPERFRALMQHRVDTVGQTAGR